MKMRIDQIRRETKMIKLKEEAEEKKNAENTGVPQINRKSLKIVSQLRYQRKSLK